MALGNLRLAAAFTKEGHRWRLARAPLPLVTSSSFSGLRYWSWGPTEPEVVIPTLV